MSAAGDVGATPRKQEAPARRAGSAPRGMALACRLIDLGVWLDEGYRIPEAKRENDVP
jgi:hypothetical protein